MVQQITAQKTLSRILYLCLDADHDNNDDDSNKVTIVIIIIVIFQYHFLIDSDIKKRWWYVHYSE